MRPAARAINMSALRGNTFEVVVAWDNRLVRISRITFTSDGFIVTLSGHKAQDGWAACVPVKHGKGQKISMAEHGRRISSLAKITFPRNGEVHISDAGDPKYIYPNGPIATLDSLRGHIFSLKAENTGQLDDVTPRDRDQLTLQLPMEQPLVAIRGWWWPASEFEAFREGPNGKTRFPGGQFRAGLFIQPPEKHPFADYVLALSIDIEDFLGPVDGPAVTLYSRPVVLDAVKLSGEQLIVRYPLPQEMNVHPQA
jgi:hypothetical protein